MSAVAGTVRGRVIVWMALWWCGVFLWGPHLIGQGWLARVPYEVLHSSTTTERNSPYWCYASSTHDTSESYHCTPVVYGIQIRTGAGYNGYDCVATPACSASAFCQLPVHERYAMLVGHARDCRGYARTVVGVSLSALAALDRSNSCYYPDAYLTFQELDATCSIPGCRLGSARYAWGGTCGDSVTIMRLTDSATRDTVARLLVQKARRHGDYLALDNVPHPSSGWMPFLAPSELGQRRLRDSIWNGLIVPYLERIKIHGEREGVPVFINLGGSLISWTDPEAPIPWHAIDGIASELPLSNCHAPAYHRYAHPSYLRQALVGLRRALERGKLVLLWNYEKSHYGGRGPRGYEYADSLRRMYDLVASTILLVRDSGQHAAVYVAYWPYLNLRWNPQDPSSPTIGDSIFRFIRWPSRLGTPVEGPDTLGLAPWRYKRCFQYGTLVVDYERDSVAVLTHVPDFRHQLVHDTLVLVHTTVASPGNGVESYLFDFGDGSSSGWIPARETAPITHVYREAGSYRVTLSTRDSLGCLRNISRVVTVTETGVEIPVADAPRLDIVSQGRKTELRVSFASAHRATLKLYRYDGAEIALLFDGVALTGQQTFALEGYPAGVYLLCLSSPHGTRCRKLVLLP
ncbi:MAG: PKD domain-containing protein [Candidatus Kapabacteria bacterium]|nr:PKD domain-containing protein [Candidatus Kapabacteria bacterium]MDW8225932.1 PKD domain-containing protein [Bacteroidota bacterium]